MHLAFECTQCGRCCEGLRVPLTVREAIAWLQRGGDVHLLCDAVAWPAEPADGDAQARYKRQRSFAGMSGAMAVRVGVILAASFPGRCPNLMDDNRCGIYAERPLVCRIYPGSINPFQSLSVESTACPPEAWDGRGPLFMRAGQLVDNATQPLIDEARRMAVHEMPAKQRLCQALGVRVAAMANEGFAVHRVPGPTLLQALHESSGTIATVAGQEPYSDWCLLTHQLPTLDILHEVHANALPADQAQGLAVEFLDLQAPAKASSH